MAQYDRYIGATTHLGYAMAPNQYADRTAVMADSDATKISSCRKDALVRHEKFYRTGRECIRGHVGLRYASSGSCVECMLLPYERHELKPWDLSTLPRSAKEAKTLESPRYFTGKPCRSGHIAPRYTASNNCVICARLEMRQIRATARKLRRKAASPRQRAIDAGESTFWPSHPCRNGHWARRSTVNNTCLECQRIAAGNEKHREYNRAYQFEHRQQYLSYRRNRLAAMRGIGGEHSAEDIKSIYAMQHGKCAYCGVSLRRGFHVDHIKPVKLGGTNSRANLQLTCEHCNVTKNAKDPITHARDIGLLL